MPVSAAIYGCSGHRLTDGERAFFSDASPWGFILFGRNIESPAQVRRLTDELRELAGRDDLPILLDQEGGRVARFRPPHWRAYPPGRRYGDLYAKSREEGLEATKLGGRLIATELYAAGINVDCLPVLDVPVPDAHDIIGDRAYGETPDIVAALGHAAAEGLMEGGVLPIMKHIPGHGRAGVDSHLDLPTVDTDVKALNETDFAPFRTLAHLPMAMTAHVVYSAIDAANPATTSSKLITDIIRTVIGFDGLLMSDDVSMQALKGTIAERTRASIHAGCDVALHCNGDMKEMEQVAAEAPILAGDTLRRTSAAIDHFALPQDFDEAAGIARFASLMGTFWG